MTDLDALFRQTEERFGKIDIVLDLIAKFFIAQIAMGLGEATDLAKAVLFLASTDSSYVVGAELAVDGGLAQL